MNVWNIFARVVVIGCLSTQVSFAMAQDDDNIYGTHRVVFLPEQSNGVLRSCTLGYRAVQADYTYLNGRPVVIVGNIGVHLFDAGVGFGLKIGVEDLTVPDAQFTRPYFAYLQTPDITTAKFPHKALDGEEGFRIFLLSFNDTLTKLISEMLDTGKVTIGFNRMKGGLDVMVPIDLTVFDAEYPSSGKVVRKRSNEAITQFSGCYQKLVEQVISKFPK